MSGIIHNKFKELLLPTIFIAMALNITAVVDSIFVSSFIGPSALAALELLEPIVLFVTVIEWLFGLGGQVMSLNCKGEFDEEGSNIYFSVAMLSTVIVCVIMLVVCYFNIDLLTSFLHAPHDTIPYIKQYAPFFFLTFPLSTLLGVISQFMRVDGQPRFSSAVIIIANVVNIILDFTFLYYFKMGVGGASLASFIGEVVAFLFLTKYYLDPKRTFRFIYSIPLRKWINSLVGIVKTGFPSASMGLFDVVLVYIMNRILIGVLSTTGLVAYSISVDALLLISILIIGVADTITSIIPLYYTQKDYYNVKKLVTFAIKITVVCSIAVTIINWIWPQAFLTLYNLNSYASTPIVVDALKISSLGFFAAAIATTLIFYYEAIDQGVISTVMAAIAALFGPLVAVFISYPILGNTGIWLSSSLGALMAILVAFIYVKINERRQDEYSGMLFINESLIEKTKNYVFNRTCSEKDEMFNYLNSLNVDKSDVDCLNLIVNKILSENSEDINVEVLVIDYDDNVNVNIKDEGKDNIFDEIKKEVTLNDNVKYSQTLGFNNIEYVMTKS